MLIQGRKKRDVYVYDPTNKTLTDKQGNVIKIQRDLLVLREDLRAMECDDAFHSIYCAIESINSSCDNASLLNTGRVIKGNEWPK